MNYFVDLKPYFNYRVVYPKDTPLNETEYIGIHNYFYFQEGADWGEVGNHEAAIRLDRTEDYDCIECEGQIVDIPDVKCDKIIIAGVCAWGYYHEKFKMEYDDGTHETVPVFFKDWACPPELVIKANMEKEADRYMKGGTLAEFKRRDGPAYIHYVTAGLDPAKKVRRIIFPDNICMYVFGVTLMKNGD